MSEEDVLKYLFETFDYAFFPSASNLCIALESDDLSSIEVFGTPDSRDESQSFKEEVMTKGEDFFVTRIRSSFPSEVEIENSETFTVGGLILVRLNRKDKGSSFRGRVRLSYEDMEGCTYQQSY